MTNDSPYNHNRSLDERDKRYEELAAKAVVPSEVSTSLFAPAMVPTAITATASLTNATTKHRATAIAFAQHYSDTNDHVAGVYRMPVICSVDVR